MGNNENCNKCSGISYCNVKSDTRCPVNNKLVSQVKHCDINTQVVKFDIFWDDLTPECQKRFMNVVREEHNYDVFPIVTLYFE